MAKIIKGKVTKIISGDVFEIEVTDIIKGNGGDFDDQERILIDSFEGEEVSEYEFDNNADNNDDVPELSSFESNDEEIEDDVSDAIPYYGIRTKEELEVKILGKEVKCEVLKRNSKKELVSKVEML